MAAWMAASCSRRRRFRAKTDCLRQSRKLEGFEAPAVEWEKTILPSRVANYDPRWLDQLCLSGVVGWGRVSPHPAFHEGNGNGPQRVIPTNAAPITFYLRDSAAWLDHALREQAVDETKLTPGSHIERLADMGISEEKGSVLR